MLRIPASVFLLRPSRDLHKHKAEWLDFLETWQQFTGAVMGKGLEDTAFFVHHGLISLNEVGTNPLRKEIAFGVAAFHRYNQRTKAEQPFTLNTTSTHDTKWSEGVRARINLLSEMPGEWKTRLESWSQWNQPKKSMVDGRLVPSPNEEVLLYQSMLGIWPVEPLDAGTRAQLCDRLQKFMLKAAREAKTHSSWVSPNEAHENALKRFICSILNDGPENNFLSDFSDFAARIAPAGICNACAQVLLKIASPGVPDFYQGNELWDLRLTDPDNRNPVDFDSRMKLLDELPPIGSERATTNASELLDHWQDSRLKLYLTREALNFRRAHRDLFLRGDYLPLEVDGSPRHSVCAFARRFENSWALVVVPSADGEPSSRKTFPAEGSILGFKQHRPSTLCPGKLEEYPHGRGLHCVAKRAGENPWRSPPFSRASPSHCLVPRLGQCFLPFPFALSAANSSRIRAARIAYSIASSRPNRDSSTFICSSISRFSSPMMICFSMYSPICGHGEPQSRNRFCSPRHTAKVTVVTWRAARKRAFPALIPVQSKVSRPMRFR